MKLHLVDANPAVASALQKAFEPFAEVEVSQGDLLAMAEGCVVSPANSFGYMDGGFDKHLRDFFGLQIESRVQAAVAQRPEGMLPVGASLLIPTGHHKIPHLLLAPTMEMPEHVDASHAYRAMRAVLRLAMAANFPASEVYCPGLATGVGGVTPEAAAHEMARAYFDSSD